MQFQVTARRAASGGTMVTGVSAESTGAAVAEFFRVLNATGYAGHGIEVTSVKIIPPRYMRQGD